MVFLLLLFFLENSLKKAPNTRSPREHTTHTQIHAYRQVNMVRFLQDRLAIFIHILVDFFHYMSFEVKLKAKKRIQCIANK